MEGYTLTVDIGTTGCKVILFDKHGSIVSKASSYFATKYLYAHWAEQNPEDWWYATVYAIKNALRKVDSKKVIGISLTGQMSGVVLLNKNKEVIRPCIIWMDRRAIEQAEKVKKRLNEKDVYKITGHRVDPAFFAMKLLWIKENEKSKFNKAKYFLLPKDYIRMKLCNSIATDYGDASGTMLLDIRKRDWAIEFIEDLKIPIEKLPRILEPYEIAGELIESSAKTFGLKHGIPIITGSGDGLCSALGAGVVKQGICHEVTGTSTVVSVCSKSLSYDPEMRVIMNCYVMPKLWLIEAPMSTTGAILEWFKNNFLIYYNKSRVYGLMSKEASKVGIGSDGLILLPYFMGERSPVWDPKAKGVLFGLTLSHSKGHFLRAILEGVAFSLNQILELFEEIGIKVKEIRSTGGGSRSKVWNQIKANVTGKPVITLKTEETTLLGAMLLALYGLGFYKSLKDASNYIIKIAERNFPDKNIHVKYSKYYSIFKQLYPRLKDLFQRFHKI
ncbi:MAG: xylulokinase [Candidatus Bathyarchaeia archaeon]